MIKIIKIFRIILIVLGISGIINAISLIFMTNFNLGFVIVLLIGILFLIYGLKFHEINKLTEKGFLKWLKILTFSGFTFMFGLMLFIGIYGSIDTVTYKEDALIVLGCGIKGETVTPMLKYRLDKAVEYHEKNEDAMIIVAGGQGPQEHITEASAMAKYLIAEGIPQEKILKEDKSTSTYENLIFSKKILDEYFNRPYILALTTNKFHIYRAEHIAYRNGIKVNRIHAGLSMYNLPVNYVREFFAVIIAWFFAR